MKYLILSSLAAALILLFCAAENGLLITRRYRIKTRLPKKAQPLKIVQLSDLHKKTYPQNWRRLILRVRSLSPDMILITGDLVSRTARDLRYTARLLSGLCALCPVYCSLGNHELDLPEEIMEEYRKMMRESGAVLLENETAVFEKNGERINIVGASLERRCYKNESGYSGLHVPSASELSNALGEKSGFTILLAHNPFFAKEYAEWGAELTFSGHVHGGVVRLPFLGGILSPERKFFPKNDLGVYDTDGKKTVVSAGIGKFRLFDPSEVLYAEIVSEE